MTELRERLNNNFKKDYDDLVKIIIFGKSFVGKTSLLNKYMDGYDTKEYKETIGVDLKIKDIDIRVNTKRKNVKLQLWDISGGKKYKRIITSYFKNANICLLCYDTNDKNIKEEIEKQIIFLEDNLDEKTIIYILGMKCDNFDDDNIIDNIQYWRSNTNKIIVFLGWCSLFYDIFVRYNELKNNNKMIIDDIFLNLIIDYLNNHYSKDYLLDRKDKKNTNNNICCSIM